MSSRGNVISPRGFIERFRPMPGSVMPGLMPPFRAFKAWEQSILRPIRPLGRLGSLEVRLARKPGEIRRAQKLRYHVFYKEGSAVADARIFHKSYGDQAGELWSPQGRLLATTHQIAYFKA